MPANRSRTLEWRRCLKSICDRNGVIEIAVARHYDEQSTKGDLLWRVRVLEVTENEVIVEQPMTLGQVINVKQGVELIAIIAVGQNRWMFQTTNLGMVNHRLNDRKSILALRLLMPASVERCQRRNYYRVDTAALSLPEVEIWPLLDPKSVIVAERANELGDELNSSTGGMGGEQRGRAAAPDGETHPNDLMPEVGPQFTGKLLNIGGGGLGMLIEPDDSQYLARHKVFWVRMSLPPKMTTPICATCKLAHTHIESSQQVYAGMAFDFTFNPSHQQFVVDQICRYIAEQQREQLKRQSQIESQGKPKRAAS